MNLCFGCYDPFQNVIYWMKQRLFPCLLYTSVPYDYFLTMRFWKEDLEHYLLYRECAQEDLEKITWEPYRYSCLLYTSKMDDIDMLSRHVPCLCKVAPNTQKYHIQDVNLSLIHI